MNNFIYANKDISLKLYKDLYVNSQISLDTYISNVINLYEFSKKKTVTEDDVSESDSGDNYNTDDESSEDDNSFTNITDNVTDTIAQSNASHASSTQTLQLNSEETTFHSSTSTCPTYSYYDQLNNGDQFNFFTDNVNSYNNNNDFYYYNDSNGSNNYY